METKTKIDDPEVVYEIMQKLLNSEDQFTKDKEHVWVICLNTRNVVIKIELVSLGTTNQSLVHPREVYRRAISINACSIVLVHNHPSGDVEASQEDISVTVRIVEGGSLLGIPLRDHVIIADSGYYSFKEERPEVFN
jgi:DNA repair protein RadC